MQTIEEAIAEAERTLAAEAQAAPAPSCGAGRRAPAARRRQALSIAGMKPSSMALLGLLGACIATGFAGGRKAHVAAGLAMAAGIGWHVWNRRRVL